MNTDARILLLEPYYGGSHRHFIEGLQHNVDGRFIRLTLPARKWKMRMQLAAPWMAEQIVAFIRRGDKFAAILCSSLLDAATLRAVLVRAGVQLPLGVYFHENQFIYPSREGAAASYQFSALNFTSALAADCIAFNSEYNRRSFLEGIRQYVKKATDMNLRHLPDVLETRSSVLYPGIDYGVADALPSPAPGQPPVIVWNHRWEHDKDPDTFFLTLFDLADRKISFRLMVLGQSFARCPEIYRLAREKLKDYIIHWGYARKRREYFRLLHQADIVVSTARHEFFGMAVLEAVRCGCRPVVPDRLAYREIFPDKYRYREGGLTVALTGALSEKDRLSARQIKLLTEKYGWNHLAAKYERWLAGLTTLGNEKRSEYVDQR